MSAAAPKKSYFDLAKEAILAIKDRTGSSPQAIKSYIDSKYPTFKFQPVSAIPLLTFAIIILYVQTNIFVASFEKCLEESC